jgi:hypothetical protein
LGQSHLCLRSQHDTINQPPIYEAKMSLQHAAKHLEKHGRNGDTVLVHMSKGEVKSLNDLAMAGGGHLTVNPHTGLPEAGFLQRLLPMAIGAGLTVASGGTLSPLAASLIVGGGYAASTGSLKKGLMAGLGAYGGAGMGASFAEAGASSVVPEAAATAPLDTAVAATPPAPVPVDPTAAVNPMPGISTAPASPPVDPNLAVNPLSGRPLPAPVVSVSPAPVTTPASAPTFDANKPFATQTMYPPAAPASAPVSAPTVETSVTAPVVEAAPASVNPNLPRQINDTSPSFQQQPGDLRNMTPSQRFEAMKSGASFDNLGDWASKNKTQAYGMGASAIMPWDEDKEEPAPRYRDSDPGQQYTYEANATSPTPMSAPSGQEQKYFNQRYVARAAGGGMMASGGISDAGYNLGGYSDGGRLLRGPGDGVSDSIPAVIGKRQPARLADGEFVVPARIVSELGNGSTEAGARKLYAMMDRIQKTRGKTVGKGKVAKNSRADKHLPA